MEQDILRGLQLHKNMNSQKCCPPPKKMVVLVKVGAHVNGIP
ncbi:hypothetical protein GGU45_003510 [Niabella hirudinis]